MKSNPQGGAIRQIENHYKIMKTLLTFIIGVGLALTSFGGQTNSPAADGLFSQSYKVGDADICKPVETARATETRRVQSGTAASLLQEQHITFQKPAGVFSMKRKA